MGAGQHSKGIPVSSRLPGTHQPRLGTKPGCQSHQKGWHRPQLTAGLHPGTAASAEHGRGGIQGVIPHGSSYYRDTRDTALRCGLCLGVSTISDHLNSLPLCYSCSMFPGKVHSTAGHFPSCPWFWTAPLGSREDVSWEQETGKSCPSRTSPSIQDQPLILEPMHISLDHLSPLMSAAPSSQPSAHACKGRTGTDAGHDIWGHCLQGHPTLVSISAGLISQFPSFPKAFSSNDRQELIPPVLLHTLSGSKTTLFCCHLPLLDRGHCACLAV